MSGCIVASSFRSWPAFNAIYGKCLPRIRLPLTTKRSFVIWRVDVDVDVGAGHGVWGMRHVAWVG